MKTESKIRTRSIIQLIKEDHRPLKAAIQTLTSEKSADSSKRKALRDFLLNLKLHSKAEELSLYKYSVSKEDLRVEILEGIQEHALADFLAKQLERSGFENKWSDQIEAKSKVLAELVKHHLSEEEKQVLPELTKKFSREEIQRLGELYLQKYQELNEKFASEKQPRSKELSRRTLEKMRPAAVVM